MYHRYDTMGCLLYTPQVPILRTEYFKYIGQGQMPYGINSIVAIMAYTGYNQEDSIIINQGALDRQMFGTGYFKKFEAAEEALDEIAHTKTEITDPITGKYAGQITPMDGYDYSSFDEDGIVKPNTILKEGMVIVGMVSPSGNGTWSEISVTTKKKTFGRVDSVFNYRNKKGLLCVKVKVFQYRISELADKFSVRAAAQKGTVEMILPEFDMLFTASGIHPDIIMNPHAIPSRMTGAMTHEMITCKAALLKAAMADGTAFVHREDPMKVYGDLLKRHRYNRLGEEYLYNGLTGERLKSTIFIGSVYYQRLKQMVADKINSRSTGPNKLLTRQPNGGRANDGGLRIGEMERDSLLSHSISAFIQESMMARSDGYETIFNPKSGRMDIMKNEETPMDISMPYSMKLLIQELESMGLETRVLAEGI